MDFNLNNIVISVKENVMEIIGPYKSETIALDHISSVEISKSGSYVMGIAVVIFLAGLVAGFFNVYVGITLVLAGLVLGAVDYFMYVLIIFHVNGRGKFPLMVQKRKANNLYNYVSELLNTRK
ncbi:hypothetical protein [Methanococcus maripaludis]|uniref:hypothetical protein n=1 Tax=Methanococcus maripaludis TaxID=39152 RepID=UPI000E6AF01A|nr:hypothetical protein [Methanococcus maripaludis]